MLVAPLCRPVRMHMDLDSNMKVVGKRWPYYATYTVRDYQQYVHCMQYMYVHLRHKQLSSACTHGSIAVMRV